jgi:amino acid transporter
MRSVVLRYGGISAAILILSFLVLWGLLGTQLSYRTNELLGYLTMVLALSTIYFGMRYFREREMEGRLSFGQGVRLGLGITLIPAFVFFLYIVVFFYWQGDSFLAYAAEEMDPEQAVLMEQNRALFVNPFFQGAVMFLTVLLLGTVISLISALILQRKG